MKRAASSRAAALLALLVMAAGCKKTSDGAAPVHAGAEGVDPKPPEATTTKVTALSVHEENLNVDKISMRDGSINPDGNRDHVFSATVEGPVDALYLVTVDEAGAPVHGFRADTIAGHEELPDELRAAGQVDVGRLTVWMAVVEEGKFVNQENGKLGVLAAGTHALKLYVPHTGTLRAGSRVRLYARAPGGAIVGGPVVPY